MKTKEITKLQSIRFRDFKFPPTTTYATFALYRYPAKFIPQVIAYVLDKYGAQGMKVFDPFAGYGTVGLVSRVYGCDYELWDLNPIIEVLHRVAILKPRDIDVENLIHQIATSDQSFVPTWSRLHYWFPKEFLPFLYRMWGFYHSLGDKYLKFLLAVPLLKTTRHFSYDDIQRQKLSKSPRSIERVHSLLKCDWKLKFLQMLRMEIEQVLKRLNEYWSLSPKEVEAIVKGGLDTLNAELDEEKDILITSPPYLQAHEYIRQAKMDLFWLGYSESYIKRLAKLEIPYRDVKQIPIYSKTYYNWRNKIKEDHIRKIFDNYFWGVLGALTRLQEKIQSYMFLFVGRANVRGSPVPIDCIFAEHFEEFGWVHEKTLVDKINSRRMFLYRNNPATGLEDKRMQSEYLVILRRRW